MREQQKNILSTDTLQYIENFKFKMEVQPIQQSQIQDYSPSSQEHFQIPKSFFQDTNLDSQILYLFSHGLPVFVFQEKITKSIQEKDQSQNDEKTSYLNERILTYNRKAKSLQELSKKFIQHFEGRGNNIIELDKITIQLGVQRRRIYDVINILQSLNVVSKKGKNNYQWKGLCQAVRTIHQCLKEGKHYLIQNTKKEKSLEYLAGGFLSLFLNWKPAISLQQAAKQMMKQIDEASIKTKIRRLYDIINVFRSLGLVRKTSLPCKKPGYQWAGTQYLQQIIMKKQYCDQNTGLNELNGEEDMHNPEERQSIINNFKNSHFSPFICSMLQSSKIDNFKLISETKYTKDSSKEQSQNWWISQQMGMQNNFFPVFRKATSAFSLVAEANNVGHD